jgi:lipopolysaccharide transport system ATP-binding protein
MYLVQKLCQRAIWLHEGRTRQNGEVYPVTQAYLAWHESRAAAEKRHRDRVSGQQGHYRITDLRLPAGDGAAPLELAMGDELEAELVLFSPDGRPPVGLVGIVRADGTPVYGVASDVDAADPVRLDESHYRFNIRFGPLDLLPGSYSVRGHAMDPEGIRVFDARECTFRVRGESNELGFIRLPHDWTG